MDQGDSQQHSSLPLAREHAELRMQYGCSIGEVQGSQDNHPSATIDCFARTDKQEVAINRNYHLQWWDHDRPTNNFVSWSSSLLFALQMICYRANHSKDAPLKYKDIQLCIIDTTKLSKDAFIRDLDLTRAFAPFDSSDNNNLTKFHDLRSGPTWYFGEYLSQGALNVENCIQLVSAKAIMDAGLQVLRPDLMLFKHAPPAKLASEVVERRKVFDQIAGLPLVERAVEDVVAITKLFGDDYKLPIAAYFSALLPREEEDDGLVNLLVALNRTGMSFGRRYYDFLLMSNRGRGGSLLARTNKHRGACDHARDDGVPEINDPFPLQLSSKQHQG